MNDTVPPGPGFTVAAVILFDEQDHVLTVRKRGTDRFMLPGGKIEPGERSDATALREVAEELGLVLEPSDLVWLGRFFTATANEPGHWLRSDVYAYRQPVRGALPRAEIAELRALDADLATPQDADLAPLLVELLDEIRARRPGAS